MAARSPAIGQREIPRAGERTKRGMSTTAEKLNQSSYRYPYALARRGYPGKIGRAMAVVYSYSNRRGDPEAACALTRERLASCAGVSPSTVARAFATLRTVEGFTQREENGRRRYALHIAAPGGCFRRYRYLFEQTFEIGGKVRRLTGTEEEILSILLSHVTNPNAKKGFEGSEGRFAELTGRSTDAVGAALRALIGAGLVHRPRRGTSRHRLSRYTVCKRLRKICFGEKEEQAQEEREHAPRALSQAERAADARAEYERHFAPLRAHAIALADAARATAERCADYTRVNGELRKLDPQIARAKVLQDKTGAAALVRRKQSLAVQRARILARLGLTEADLRPKWHCPACEDTLA